MSVTRNSITRLSEEELKRGVFDAEKSWHYCYRDSCYVFVGGLLPQLTEGDVAIVFSQWGEVVDVHLTRDARTGKSRGFGFVGYEDQRSTVLAVDNFNNYELVGRKLRVDHCAKFRAPRGAAAGAAGGGDGNGEEAEDEYLPTGAEGFGYRTRGMTSDVAHRR